MGRGRRWQLEQRRARSASLLANVHPDEEVRTTCEQAEVEVDKLVTELRQDRGALRRVRRARRRPGSTRPAARLLEKTLDDFRRAGVDRDDATRARLAEINERLTELDQEFSRNIRDDVRTVRVDARAARRAARRTGSTAHPADDDGLVTVTTDYPDAIPARMFVHDADVRRAGHRRLPRARLARTTSRCSRSCSTCATSWPTWSATPTGRRTTPTVKMIEKGPAIPEFIDRIAAGRRGADASATSTCCSSATGRTCPDAERDRRRRLASTTRSWSARSSTTSTPSWCAPTSTSTRCSRGCST